MYVVESTGTGLHSLSSLVNKTNSAKQFVNTNGGIFVFNVLVTLKKVLPIAGKIKILDRLTVKENATRATRGPRINDTR